VRFVMAALKSRKGVERFGGGAKRRGPTQSGRQRGKKVMRCRGTRIWATTESISKKASKNLNRGRTRMNNEVERKTSTTKRGGKVRPR